MLLFPWLSASTLNPSHLPSHARVKCAQSIKTSLDGLALGEPTNDESICWEVMLSHSVLGGLEALVNRFLWVSNDGRGGWQAGR